MTSAAAARTITPAPVRKTVRVKADPARAFEVFTSGMSRWWNPANKIGPGALREAVVEPRAGGRWYEIDDDGSETEWGRVLVWEPPTRVVLAWQVTATWSFDPAFVTEVEVRFRADGADTVVELEHRHLERFGAAEAELRAAFESEGGWYGMLEAYRKLIG